MGTLPDSQEGPGFLGRCLQKALPILVWLGLKHAGVWRVDRPSCGGSDLGYVNILGTSGEAAFPKLLWSDF